MAIQFDLFGQFNSRRSTAVNVHRAARDVIYIYMYIAYSERQTYVGYITAIIYTILQCALDNLTMVPYRTFAWQREAFRRDEHWQCFCLIAHKKRDFWEPVSTYDVHLCWV